MRSNTSFTHLTSPFQGILGLVFLPLQHRLLGCDQSLGQDSGRHDLAAAPEAEEVGGEAEVAAD